MRSGARPQVPHPIPSVDLIDYSGREYLSFKARPSSVIAAPRSLPNARCHLPRAILALILWLLGFRPCHR